MHQIGVGVLGPVYRTYDPEHDRLVAVKAFQLDLTPEQAARFASALTALASTSLSHHAIVAPIAAGLSAQGVPYLAQEYVAAESLDVAMRHYAPAPLATALPFITQLAEALDFAHARGVVHGALHLRDVFVTPDRARAGGFGVVKTLEALGLRGPIRRPYTAPEQIAAAGWGAEADRFALGAIAYELLTGKRAAGSGEQVASRLEGVEVAAHAALKQVFARALAEHPSRRYASCGAFVTAIQAAAVPGDLAAEAPLGDTSPRRERSTVAVFPPRGQAASPRPARPREREQDADLFATLARDEEGSQSQPGAAPSEAEQRTDGDTVEKRWTLGEPDPERGEPDLELVDRWMERPTAERSNEPFAGPEDDQSTDPSRAREGAGSEAAPEMERDAIEENAAESEGERPPLSGRPPIVLSSHEESAPGEPDQPDDEAQLSEGGRNGDDGRALRRGAADHPQLFDGDAGQSVEREGGTAQPKRAILPVAIAIVVGTLAAYIAAMALGLGGGSTTLGDEVLSPTGGGEPVGRDFSERAVSEPAAAGAVDQTPPAAPGTPTEEPAAAEPANVAPPTALAEPVAVPEPETVEPAAPRSPPPAPRPAPQPPARVEPAPSAESATPVVARTGWILVRTSPPGAQVSVDGDPRGTTPVSLPDIELGPHAVRIGLTGYEPHQLNVDLTEAQPVAAVNVDLRPAAAASPGPPAAAPTPPAARTGALLVESRPAGAQVQVDGRAVGTTPLLLSGMAAGSHSVRIEIQGYQVWTTAVDVVAAQQTRVAASLDRMR